MVYYREMFNKARFVQVIMVAMTKIKLARGYRERAVVVTAFLKPGHERRSYAGPVDVEEVVEGDDLPGRRAQPSKFKVIFDDFLPMSAVNTDKPQRAGPVEDILGREPERRRLENVNLELWYSICCKIPAQRGKAAPAGAVNIQVLILEHVDANCALVIGERETERDEGFTLVHANFGCSAADAPAALEQQQSREHCSIQTAEPSADAARPEGIVVTQRAHGFSVQHAALIASGEGVHHGT